MIRRRDRICPGGGPTGGDIAATAGNSTHRRARHGAVRAAAILFLLFPHSPLSAQTVDPAPLLPEGLGSDLLSVTQSPDQRPARNIGPNPDRTDTDVIGALPELPDPVSRPDPNAGTEPSAGIHPAAHPAADDATAVGAQTATPLLPDGPPADTTPAIAKDAHGSGAAVTAPGRGHAEDALDGSGWTGQAQAADARALLADLWREAVRTGGTTLGFSEWMHDALQDGDTASPADNIPRAANTGPDAVPDSGPDTQADRTRAISLRWLDRAGPVALGAAGRVVTVFGSAIPTALCSPLTVCTIMLEPGELLTDAPSWGDTVRWQVTVKKQGADTVLLETRPAEDAEITNLVIPTDRRLYTIRLVNDAEVHTPILSFSYPDTVERKAREAIAARDAEQTATATAQATARATTAAARTAELARSGVETDRGRRPAEDLDFAFRVDGRAAFRPVRVFADGAKTYIDLPPRYRGALPAIVAGPGETNAALNTRVSQGGTRLIADRVITDIWLQSGKTRVRIQKVAP